MRFLAFITGACLFWTVSSFAPTDEDYTYEFALRLTPSGTSLISTAIVTVNKKQVVKAEVINEMQFLMEVSGLIHSRANPAPDDLFKKNGIAFCSQVKDTIRYTYKGFDSTDFKTRQKTTGFVVENGKATCPMLKELWKLRYRYDIRVKNYNYRMGQEGDGWAADRFFPNLAQINYLKSTYGCDLINEYVYGKNLFKLMKDVQDTAWVNSYKKLK